MYNLQFILVRFKYWRAQFKRNKWGLLFAYSLKHFSVSHWSACVFSGGVRKKKKRCRQLTAAVCSRKKSSVRGI